MKKIGVKDDDLCERGEIGDLNHVVLGCRNRQAQNQSLYSKLAKMEKTPIQIGDILKTPNSPASQLVIDHIIACNLKL